MRDGTVWNDGSPYSLDHTQSASATITNILSQPNLANKHRVVSLWYTEGQLLSKVNYLQKDN